MDFSKHRPSEWILQNQFVAIPFNGLRLIGIIITSDQAKKHFIKGILSYLIFMAFAVLELWNAATSTDITVMASHGAIVFCLISVGSRMIYFFIFKPKEFFELIGELDADIRRSKANATLQENEIIKDSHTYAKRLSQFLVTSTQANCIFLGFMHLWKSNFNPVTTLGTSALPPMIQNRWPYENLPFSMYLVNLFNVAATFVGCAVMPSLHAIMSNMTVFLIMNLKLLNHKLEHIHEYVHENDALKRNDQAYNLLVEHIKRHLYLKDYLNKIQEMGGKFLFIDFIIYSVQLCFMLYQIVAIKDIGMLIFTFNYVSTLVAILWLYYYHGNEIIYHSNLISMSIYLSNWYEFDLKFRKAMLQLMTNSHEPMKMYAGIVEVNIPNFIGIMKAGYSYMTILRQRSN